MEHGGARINSGPPKDPGSLRSARLALKQLPAAGYTGQPPAFPLPKILRYDVYFEDKRRIKEYDEAATEAAWDRERELWETVWRTPQATAWAVEEWRWLTIALYVRTFVVCEGSEATAADKGSLHRLADQIGLTPAGLQYNGWKIEQVAAKPAAERAPVAQPNTSSAAARFRVIAGGQSA